MRILVIGIKEGVGNEPCFYGILSVNSFEAFQVPSVHQCPFSCKVEK